MIRQRRDLARLVPATLSHRNSAGQAPCGWEVIYPVLGPIPNGAGTMVLRVVLCWNLASWQVISLATNTSH